MQTSENRPNTAFKPIEDASLVDALNSMGRAINIAGTYGTEHPAFQQAIDNADICMKALFIERRKVHIGAFNGSLTIDQQPVEASGTLLKSLERRLVNLQITSLRLAQGINADELIQLAKLLSSRKAEEFQAGMTESNLSHIASEETRYEAVHEGQTVANESDLASTGADGVLVLEDDSADDSSGGGDAASSVHVDQIVAFLKGDVDLEDADIDEELAELVSDPNRLGQMIMESVSIRQSAAELSGESLGDIILGCLRRTFEGLRKQPAFKTSEGMADMKKALLLLEESMLNKMRAITSESNPELDRQIVQAVREMDDQFGFEIAAQQYMEQRKAMEEQKEQLQSFVRNKGTGAAEELLADTGFPPADWRRIVVDSQKSAGASGMQMMDGLNNITKVFEQLEHLMRSEENKDEVKALLGQANEDLDDTIHTTKEKLDSLSKQLSEEEIGTIGGHGLRMSRNELLSSIAEVAQELMQPLTAINASIEMMLQGFVGNVNSDQQELLQLAHNSGDHLRYLMDELINIVGCPTNKGVDDRYHTTSDEVASMIK
jgi:signal transduction histidine kinase